MLPKQLNSTIHSKLPAHWNQPRESIWTQANMRGSRIGSFLEGPSFDRDGNLYLVDLPFGRIFCISPKGEWTLRCEYDGWPNGLKIHRDGRLFIADYRHGILELCPGQSRPQPVVTTYRSEGFSGCNDLFFDAGGSLWFTDQGQSGLHDPNGRVFHLGKDGTLRCILSHIPSPNGLVMNSSERQLYIAVTRANAIWRLPLMEDGGVSKVGLFIQLSGGLAGPDGMALDDDGGLVVAHPGIGVWRFDNVGRATHVVESPAGSMWTNIAFGGEGNRELFIVDSMTAEVHVAIMPFGGKKMFSHTAY
jgi:gluconolactonase